MNTWPLALITVAGLSVGGLCSAGNTNSAAGKYWVKNPLEYDRTIPWQLKEGAIVCQDNLKLKDAQAAAKAADQAWLAETGCEIAPSVERVVLIDAQHYQQQATIWRGRVYLPNGSSADRYFSEMDAMTFATPTGGGSTPSLYSSTQEIDQDLKKFGWLDLYRDLIPYRTVQHGRKLELWFGPAPYRILIGFCHFRTRCVTVGQIP